MRFDFIDNLSLSISAICLLDSIVCHICHPIRKAIIPTVVATRMLRVLNIALSALKLCDSMEHKAIMPMIKENALKNKETDINKLLADVFVFLTLFQL